MAFMNIVINGNDTSADLGKILADTAGNTKGIANRLAAYMASLPGPRGGTVTVNRGAVQATGTLTFTGLPLAAETFTINGTTITARASGAVNDEFNIGADATATAANVVTAINASTTPAVTDVTASSAAGVVTFTSDVPGVVGNNIGLTEALTNATVSGATLASGTNGTKTTLTL